MINRFSDFFRKKKKFQAILKANSLDLDYAINKSSFQLLESIFIQREYADYFPFYQKSIIVDIGAHKGYFTLFASLNTDKQSRIVSVEPVSSNFKILEQNIKQNGNITTIKAAVAAFDGQLDIHLSHDTNHSMIAMNPLSGQTNAIEKVKAITLDSLFKDHSIDRVDFLKMDCEGAEYDILLNASVETLEKINILSLEFHDLKSSEKNANKLIEHLEDKNFKVVKFCYEPSNYGLNYGKLIFQKINP